MKNFTEEQLRKAATGINPSGSKANCGSVASAVIANLKGGNYVALDEVPEHMRLMRNGIITQGYDPDKLIDCYEGGKWESKHGNTRRELSDNVEKAILEYGDGSVGLMYPEEIRLRNTGHYFTWAVSNGKVNVIEGQPKNAQSQGIVWNNDFYHDVGQLFNSSFEVKISRLDNCPVKQGRESDLYKKRNRS